MSKYRTNSYILTLFDERGTKIEQKNLGNVGIIQAKAVGDEMIQTAKAASFSLARNIFNSLDSQTP